MSVKRRRLSPLSYEGVNATTPPNFVANPRNPGPRDYSEFNLGNIWLNTITEDVWFLVNKDAQIACWRMFGGTGSGILTLTGDSGGAVPGDGANNINLLGTANEITTTGSIPTNTLTISIGASVALNYVTDSGSATALNNEVNVFGMFAVSTSGASNTITISAGSTIPLQFDADTDFAIVIGNQVNWVGGNLIDTVGDTGNKLTINMDPAVANQYVTDSGTAQALVGILNVSGGDNINTSGSGNTVTSILDTSILQPSSNVAGDEGVYSLGSTDYITDRFLFNLGSQNTFLGRQAANFTFATGSALNNTFGGYQSGNALFSGQENTFVGSNAGNLVTSGNNNIAIGSNTPNAQPTQNNNVLMKVPGQSIDDFFAMSYVAASNVAILHNFPGGSFGDSNIFAGGASGNFSMAPTALRNVGANTGSLRSLTTGTDNTTSGKSSQAKVSTGTGNTSFGNDTLFKAAGTTGITTGSYNTAIGYASLTNFTSSESNNIGINDFIVPAGSNNQLQIGRDTGTSTQFLNAAYIHGIFGKTASGGSALRVNSSNKIGTVTSSRQYKTNIEPLGSFSSVVYDLTAVLFNYRDTPDQESFGLIAEEIHNICPALCIYDKEQRPDGVHYENLTPLLLREVQELKQKLENLQKKLS